MSHWAPAELAYIDAVIKGSQERAADIAVRIQADLPRRTIQAIVEKIHRLRIASLGMLPATRIRTKPPRIRIEVEPIAPAQDIKRQSEEARASRKLLGAVLNAMLRTGYHEGFQSMAELRARMINLGIAVAAAPTATSDHMLTLHRESASGRLEKSGNNGQRL